MRALLVLVAACGTPSAPPVTSGPLPLSPLPIDAAKPAVTFAADAIVVEVSELASHTDAPVRSLRRIVAARRGNVEVTPGFGEVGLVVTRVVAGKLADPDYAKRPHGANHLEVVLVDEAGHVATSDARAYAGTWHLTQLADGTLVAASLEDTPLTPKVDVLDPQPEWRAWIAATRADLRAAPIDRRVRGLSALFDHHAYELVPDVIELLDDDRPTEGLGRVGDFADRLLHDHAVAIGADHGSRTRDGWTKFWAERFTQIDPLPVVVPTTATEHVRLFAHRAWPVLARSDSGLVVGVSRLEHEFDGNEAGIFVNGETRRWITRTPHNALEVAGTGMVWMDTESHWHFATTTGKSAVLPSKIANGQWASIAPSGDGYLVLGVDDSRHVHAVVLDDSGKQRRKAKLGLPAADRIGAHGVFVAPRPGGWLAVATTNHGIVTLALDSTLRVRASAIIATRGEPAQLAVGRDRAMVAWNRGNEIETVMIDLDGKRTGEITATGDGVWEVSAPIALDDGFALAWVEAARELHVGRFDRDGVLTSNVVVQDRHIAPFSSLQLARDGAALLVTFLDVSRYPYTVVTRRL